MGREATRRGQLYVVFIEFVFRLKQNSFCSRFSLCAFPVLR